MFLSVNMPLNREQRKQDMLWLRKNQLWSLKQIGNKYNISGVRVGQILGANSLDIGCSKYALQFKTNGTRPDLTNEQFSNLIGCSETTIYYHQKGIRHETKECNSRTGAEWEKWASIILIENGIENILMPWGASFDILAFNKIRIEVKVAVKNKKSPSTKCISPVWSFNIRNDKKPNATDFFFLIIAPVKEIFIIPNDRLSSINKLSLCYPTLRPTMFKWESYHNAYYLIQQ